MKELSSLLWALLLCFLLCACGEGKDSVQQSNNVNSSQSTEQADEPEVVYPAEKLAAVVGTWMTNAKSGEQTIADDITTVEICEDGICVINGTEYHWVFASENPDDVNIEVMNGDDQKYEFAFFTDHDELLMQILIVIDQFSSECYTPVYRLTNS